MITQTGKCSMMNMGIKWSPQLDLLYLQLFEVSRYSNKKRLIYLQKYTQAYVWELACMYMFN